MWNHNWWKKPDVNNLWDRIDSVQVWKKDTSTICRGKQGKGQKVYSRNVVSLQWTGANFPCELNKK